MCSSSTIWTKLLPVGLLPLGIRTRLSCALRRQLKAANLRARAEMPSMELDDQHLRSVRVLKNRQTLLELLPQGGQVAELGVAQGDFSAQILKINQPRCLHLIDAWHTRRYHDGLAAGVQERFQAEIEAGRVQVHRGRSTERLSMFEDGFFDWIYIDTTHDYQLTAQELALGRRKVKAGGILAGHDYVTGNWDDMRRYGVVEAVNEFCVHQHWEFVYLTHETNRHLSFALRAIADGAAR